MDHIRGSSKIVAISRRIPPEGEQPNELSDTQTCTRYQVHIVSVVRPASGALFILCLDFSATTNSPHRIIACILRPPHGPPLTYVVPWTLTKCASRTMTRIRPLGVGRGGFSPALYSDYYVHEAHHQRSPRVAYIFIAGRIGKYRCVGHDYPLRFKGVPRLACLWH